MPASPGSEQPERFGRARRGGRAVVRWAASLERSDGLVDLARRVRQRLPGDARFGDSLSTAGSDPAQAVARRVAELTDERPGLLREVGLSALQVWQSVSEAQGRGRGETELAVAFTDLEEFSSFALRAGDEAALALLRDVADAIEPPIKRAGGRIVKRLGDGMMVVFGDPDPGARALHEAMACMAGLERDGYAPRLRAGLHLGRPRRLGSDYLGVDVNIAARLAEEASGGELLVSGPTLARLNVSDQRVRKKRRFRVKGAPRDLDAYSIRPER